MQTKSFFGDKGLTSTSANHYANLAKEMGRKIQNYLSNVCFYSTNMRIIGDANGGTIKKGLTPEHIDSIQEGLQLLSQTHSLIAFFREAIKEKEHLANEAKRWTDEAVHADFDARYKELSEAKPVREDYITEEDVIKSWTVGEQEKYLSLEAEASVYGKFIHEDGALSEARQDLMRVMSNPMSVTEKGRDTVIYDYVPTVNAEDVDALFFDLQKHQREVQAELNGMKKKVQDTIEENKMRVDEQYALAFQDWTHKVNAMNRELQTISEKESATRQKMLQEVQNLKIIVPNRLKTVFESLQNL